MRIMARYAQPTLVAIWSWTYGKPRAARGTRQPLVGLLRLLRLPSSEGGYIAITHVGSTEG